MLLRARCVLIVGRLVVGEARPLFKADELGRLKQRVTFLEKRLRVDQAALAETERRLLVERELRAKAERNAKRFHAQVLAARIALVNAKRQP